MTLNRCMMYNSHVKYRTQIFIVPTTQIYFPVVEIIKNIFEHVEF